MDTSLIYIKTVSNKGQIVIPERLRTHLAVKPDQRVKLHVTAKGNLVIIPVKNQKIPG